MQLVHCTVNLAGDPRKQVRRINVSVPEIQVLKSIHGEDAVVDLEYAGDRKDTDEMEHLLKFYGGKPEIKETIEKLFPGARPALPQTLDLIGYPDVATPEAIEAYEAKKAEQDEQDAKMDRKRKAAKAKREALTAAAEALAVDESEIVRPPKPGKKRVDALMG